MKITGLAALLLAGMVGAGLLFAQSGPAPGEWQTYSGDAQGRRYSPLTQINTTNVAGLKLAWQYNVAGVTPGSTARTAAPSQAVPIVMRGVLYTSTTQRTIVALDPVTGREIWKHELEKGGAPNRGVSYWPGDREFAPRILAGTTDGRLIALDAATGRLVPTFGDRGAINLRAGVADNYPDRPYMMASPGLIYRNLIVTGAQGQEDNSEGPAMDVRAWDIRTGTLVWTFHTIPHPGEPAYDTWPKDYWKTAGTPANWGFGSVDTARGLIFLPIGQPAAQYYGGHRAQRNLYASSVVALDARNGKVRWHFQLTHHDVWDYDNAATPALVDVLRNGRPVPAVVTVAKSGLMFFLERETGKPIYPVEERPVPQSDIPGEATSPTQPFPVKPPPLSRLSITPAEIFTGEPTHEKFCRDLVEQIGGIHNLGPYTPYSNREFRIVFPGQQGGPNFGGVAVDQGLGYVFVNSRDVGGMGRLDKTPDGDTVAYRRFSPLGRGTVNARFWNPATALPCQQPPWAHLMAINANTGDIVWRVPLGTSDELEARGMKNTGAFGQGGSIATAGGLVFIAGTVDRRFRAFDSRTGAVKWEARLESEGHTTPMTYMAPNGKQYVVVVTTGVNAFALE
ncbi:MAG TPA: pyrroloquinoline quinone-dependent dehydrogenase [Vicinamibacterales bacterium]|nr:pyrroloquinoline quinone-dependent dehydrogenase [Vicinamibacterales bacterium]